MWSHHFKIAFRSLVKNKAYTAINIGGLGLGLAACIVIGVYVWGERSHDRFHQNFDQLYRVVEIQEQPGGMYNVAMTPGPLAHTLEQDFPEVVRTTRIGRWRALLQMDGKNIEPQWTIVVDTSFFAMFDFKLLAGNPATALRAINEIVISETLAEQFFGKDWRRQAVVGQTLLLNPTHPMTIAGVIENAPANSQLSYDALLPMEWLLKNDPWASRWDNNNLHTYLQLLPGTDAPALEQKIAGQIAKHTDNNQAILQLQPLRDIYLHSKFDFGTDWGKRGDVAYLRIFLWTGLIVLLIAVANFVNMATARVAPRVREVGVRKSLGAPRRSLIAQFLSESFLLVAGAVATAVLLLELALPAMALFTDKPLSVPYREPGFWLALTGGALLTGMAAGAWPALFLSAFQPAKVLKGVFDARSGARLRQTLVAGQFALSIALGVGAVVIYEQLSFMQYKNLGFDQTQLLYLNLKGASRDKAEVFKDVLGAIPGVAAVSATTSNLVNADSGTTIEWEGQDPDDSFLITQMNIDADFLTVTGIELAAGRNYSTSVAGDTSDHFGRFLLNETAARRIGFPGEEAIGRKLKFWGQEGEVIGVLKDFHFQPLSKALEPMILRYRPKESYACLLLKIAPGDIPGAIAAIEKSYKAIEADQPFSYGFVNQDLHAQYLAEKRTGYTVLAFSILAVLVSCLGLFGLALFTAEQRTKEIGIRKVLGASVTGIAGLLAKDFLKLVLIAIVIASPVAYYFMDKWLADFAYRIELEWWMFTLAGVAAISIAFFTVSFQSVRAALTNPVESLRSE
ncbi:MAG: ABC transporter permease [Saprospiraceae bacterium]|nr:ABC transporter permease [Saprospiraceae bacterium]